MIRGVSRSLRRISEAENPVVLCADERVEVREYFSAEALPIHEDAEPDAFGQPRVPSSTKLFPGHLDPLEMSKQEHAARRQSIRLG
jgi:hypothetical protein